MKMAKASQADLNMAMDLVNALAALGQRFYPCMPEAIERLGEDDERANFDRDDDAQCGRALRHLLEIAERGSLFRVVWSMVVLLDPRNRCVDPDADTIEHHPDVAAALAARTAKPLAEWHEDHGAALWWRFPVEEAPWCGTPLCDDWPHYHTHWTPLVVPAAAVTEAPGAAA